MPKRKTKTKSTSTSSKKKKKSTKTKTMSGKSIYIEACKSWGIFKRSAEKLKQMLPEQNFIINDGWDNVDKSNKDKTKRPGKGNFVVTIGDTKIVNLIQMPRPFQKLRELNFDDVVEKILEDGKYVKRLSNKLKQDY